MNKKARAIIAAFVTAAAFVSSVYAVDMNYYGDETSPEMTAEKQNMLHFEGSLGSEGSNRMATLIIMKPGKSLSDMGDDSAVARLETVSVNYDGTFEYKFGFNEESGIYQIYVLCGDERYDDTYNYKSWSDILGLFTSIKNQTVVYSDIEDFAQSLGLDLSAVSKDGYKNTVVTRIKGRASEFTKTESDVNLLKSIFANAKEEFAELNNIETADNWSKLPSALEKLTELTGVKYDYKGASKQLVCQKLIGREYMSAEAVKTDFDNAVSAIQNGAGGSGSGTGGTGGGSKVTGGGTGGSYMTGDYIPSGKPSDIREEGTNAFSDISDLPWAVKPINYLYNKGVLSGVGDGRFMPNETLKREEIVKIIVLAFNAEETDAPADFHDVDEKEWYAPYIARAKNCGIVGGISETIFGVGMNITRQDIAVLIYRAATYAGIGFSKQKTDFSDYDGIADYAKEAVSALAGAGIINGFPDGSFGPEESATRAQAARMIYSVTGGDK